jgi:predicted RNase H-like HicB family nuclease
MSDELRLTVRYTDAGDGWVTAQVSEVPGAISQGRNREEARANVIDALAVVLTPDEELAGEPPDDESESLTLTVAS